MTKKAFIFDLDGVIVDTAKYHFLAWQKIASQIGIEFTPEHNENLKGVSRIRSLDLILELAKIEASQESKDLWLAQKNADYLESIKNMGANEILPGIMQTLDYLKSQNQPIALGSASKNARPILEKVGIIHYFDAIVDGNEVVNAKPDPEVFLQAAKKLHMPSKNAIVFEDSLAGIQAANNAQMISIGIGSAEVLTEAQFIFPDFSHIDKAFIDTLINI